MRKIYPYFIAFLLLATACTDEPTNFKTGYDASIFPDYTDITVPSNIAPVNFIIQDTALKYLTILESGNIKINIRGNKVRIPLKKWRNLTAQGNITVTIFEEKENGWNKMKPFFINIADEIDPYLTYRIIPPLFESYQKLSINQLSQFQELAY